MRRCRLRGRSSKASFRTMQEHFEKNREFACPRPRLLKPRHFSTCVRLR
jgi:hypothetical protein